MTVEEMDARKLKVIRYIINEATTERLQLFESTRLLFCENTEETSPETPTYNKVQEPEIAYETKSVVSKDKLKVGLVQYLLNQVRDMGLPPRSRRDG